MKYAVGMGSDVMIYMQSLVFSGVQNLIGGIYRHREEGDGISLLHVSRLKMDSLKQRRCFTP
jgi:hypothetical protein